MSVATTEINVLKFSSAYFNTRAETFVCKETGVCWRQENGRALWLYNVLRPSERNAKTINSMLMYYHKDIKGPEQLKVTVPLSFLSITTTDEVDEIISQIEDIGGYLDGGEEEESYDDEDEDEDEWDDECDSADPF